MCLLPAPQRACPASAFLEEVRVGLQYVLSAICFHGACMLPACGGCLLYVCRGVPVRGLSWACMIADSLHIVECILHDRNAVAMLWEREEWALASVCA